MPFGLTNVPASFQAIVNHVLRKYLNRIIIVYLDDIFIFSENLEEYIEHVYSILKELRDAKLLVELEKSFFHM